MTTGEEAGAIAVARNYVKNWVCGGHEDEMQEAISALEALITREKNAVRDKIWADFEKRDAEDIKHRAEMAAANIEILERVMAYLPDGHPEKWSVQELIFRERIDVATPEIRALLHEDMAAIRSTSPQGGRNEG